MRQDKGSKNNLMWKRELRIWRRHYATKKNQSETLERHLYKQLKENKDVQMKLKEAQVLKKSLKERISKSKLVEWIRSTKLALKKKVKELRRTIVSQKKNEQLQSKDSTIANFWFRTSSCSWSAPAIWWLRLLKKVSLKEYLNIIYN